jgi:hypothetical protein
MCGGMGYYEPTKLGTEGKLFSKIIAENTINEDEKNDSLENRESIKKESYTPSYIINNPQLFNKETFVNLLDFLINKIEELEKKIGENLAQIETLKSKIISVQEILRVKCYGVDKKVKIKKADKWIQLDISKKKNKSKVKKSKTVKDKPFSFKQNNSSSIKIKRATIGDIFKLGLVKPLKK